MCTRLKYHITCLRRRGAPRSTWVRLEKAVCEGEQIACRRSSRAHSCGNATPAQECRNAEMLPLTLSLLSTPFSRALPLPRSKYNIGTSFLTWSIAISSCHLSPLVSFPHRSHMIFSGRKSESYHSSCLKLFKSVQCSQDI